ncbi:SH3 domain-binding protein 5-like isoform X2 [Amphibalanus amphitrite]|uniref:SH3 domain-binding protein 5-like isoform X2 n=1 Tax=Amphibalanus amphitrite TaxID=1232801 RepID=UPI001C91D6AA|nr:SH3 domain-binding protein 5-like isoform X2 [Amphibalanus amphitrite]XP_043216520.1 SH3 domain-binding protein 5-like isoform X2 [Amphibalanus amphitrite]XP_043216521.1 SH3 domain-binding protein 5-like isoform X2 [Amphibalanus amphitrite]XP_043216522.1 SH3 domain-binding protein 5-like isoform X2 [Amphibalanus amphitrite]XP_043216523.1 SH3 domain-binding protein 5-like isoform X2 [Amphibalanus amphitrite]
MPYDELDSPAAEKEQQNRLDLIHPQIHVELEQLNCATDSINKLELELDDARAQFRSLLIESTQKIDALAKKLGSCVDKSRPYYEARIKAKEALQRTQDAAVLYERATSHHQAAKELVALAEEGLTSQGHAFDQSWQEMLNHSTEKVNRAEYDRTESAKNHELCSREYQRIDGRVKQLQKELKREIARSRPYFEMKAHFNQLMEMQKRQVSELESEVQASKLTYSQTLRRLEEISNQIHQARGTEEAAAALRAATGAADGARSPPALENGAIGRLGPAGRSGMSTSSTLPSLLGEDPLGLDDEFYPPPYRLSGSRSHLQLYRNGDSGREQRLSVPRDDDRSDTESLASVSTVSSVDPLSDQQIGYIALDDELQEVAAGATCVVNHNFSLSPLDGPGHDNIDQAVARLSAASLGETDRTAEGRPVGAMVNGEGELRGGTSAVGASGGQHGPHLTNGSLDVSDGAAAAEGAELRTPVAETPPAAPGLQ